MKRGVSKSLYYFFSAGMNRAERGAWRPNMDICETAECVVVSLEVPGVRPEDIEVIEHGDKLIVRGVRRPQTAPGTNHYHQIEMVCGEFEKEILLASPLRGAPVEATLSLGILSLRIGKETGARGAVERTIRIEAR